MYMGAFGTSFLWYFVELLVLAIVGIAGIFAGKALRKRKDAKMAAEKIQEEK
jgi:hypothetical protein